jgi:hypothetical protein
MQLGFSNQQITSKLVSDCNQSFMQLAQHKKEQLVRVPGHRGIDGNKMANQLAKLGPQHLFTGPKPACSISMGDAMTVVRDWTFRDHRKHLDSICRLKQTYALIQGPSV